MAVTWLASRLTSLHHCVGANRAHSASIQGTLSLSALCIPDPIQYGLSNPTLCLLCMGPLARSQNNSTASYLDLVVCFVVVDVVVVVSQPHTAWTLGA